MLWFIDLVFCWLFGKPNRRQRQLIQQWKERQQKAWEVDQAIHLVIADYERRLLAARHHLDYATNWREPDGKDAFTRALYPDYIPDYLWYAIGNHNMSSLTCEESLEICFAFSAGIDDGPPISVQIRKSGYADVGLLICVRHPRMFFTEIFFRGNACPLYQVGFMEDFFPKSNGPMANFRELLKVRVLA